MSDIKCNIHHMKVSQQGASIALSDKQARLDKLTMYISRQTGETKQLTQYTFSD